MMLASIVEREQFRSLSAAKIRNKTERPQEKGVKFAKEAKKRSIEQIDAYKLSVCHLHSAVIALSIVLIAPSGRYRIHADNHKTKILCPTCYVDNRKL